MKVLIFYNATQTYTNTVFEHVISFARYSALEYLFCHGNEWSRVEADLDAFDAVAIHYSVRLPYDQISPSLAQKLQAYRGLKVLFIQDEYDHTNRAGDWVRRLGVQLIFTVVPPASIDAVYPPAQFPGVRFVSNLTGYVPEELPLTGTFVPTSKRSLVVGYRGRPLPLRYGQLGFEKVEIGRQVKAFCQTHAVSHDISWAEKDRIYGAKWYEFVSSCRAMLGTESGSNVFDRDGTLGVQLTAYRTAHPRASDATMYAELVSSRESPGLMNQISPRIFEAVALCTALVLYEGAYSGVVQADKHYIPLRKDGRNLAEVIRQLQDDQVVDRLTQNAYNDIIQSAKYSYAEFVSFVDREIALSLKAFRGTQTSLVTGSNAFDGFATNKVGQNEKEVRSFPTLSPIRAAPPVPIRTLVRIVYVFWNLLPERVQDVIKPVLKRLIGR